MSKYETLATFYSSRIFAQSISHHKIPFPTNCSTSTVIKWNKQPNKQKNNERYKTDTYNFSYEILGKWELLWTHPRCYLCSQSYNCAMSACGIQNSQLKTALQKRERYENSLNSSLLFFFVLFVDTYKCAHLTSCSFLFYFLVVVPHDLSM